MIDDCAVLLARIEALEKENAAFLLLLEKQGIAYDGDRGLKKIIACYKALRKAKIGAQLYEMDDEPTTLKFMENLNGTYRQISEDVDAQMEAESET